MTEYEHLLIEAITSLAINAKRQADALIEIRDVIKELERTAAQVAEIPR